MKLVALVLALVCLPLAGCTGNPTNEPSVADIEKANADRAAAVDNDPTLTAKQKADMKAHMNLGKSGGSTTRR